MKKIIYLPLIVLITMLTLISCDWLTGPYKEPDYLNNDLWENRFDRHIDMDKIDVIVSFEDFIQYHDLQPKRIHIWSDNSFSIESCFLFINNNEIRLGYYHPSNSYTGSYVMHPGETYHIKLIINESIYETNHIMPSIARISLPKYNFNSKKKYTFEWLLANNYDAQFVGITVETAFIPVDYLLNEVKPSQRSYTIKAGTIHSDYRFKGVTILGINYNIIGNVLFLTEAEIR